MSTDTHYDESTLVLGETSSLTHQYCHVAAFVPNWVPSIWLGGVTVSWLSMVPKFMANGDM